MGAVPREEAIATFGLRERSLEVRSAFGCDEIGGNQFNQRRVLSYTSGGFARWPILRVAYTVWGIDDCTNVYSTDDPSSCW